MTNNSVKSQNKASRQSARLTVVLCVTFIMAMFAMSYAAVPLYDLFCRVTGYGGTTQVAESESDIVLDRDIIVRFDANVATTLPWKFKPLERQVRLKIGETYQATYRATNISNHPIVATSTFNVTPQVVGSYFNKLECFCFTEQKLEPGETVDMPVVFFVDPAIAEDRNLDFVHTITLSYTFSQVKNPSLTAAQQEQRFEKGNNNLEKL